MVIRFIIFTLLFAGYQPRSPKKKTYYNVNPYAPALVDVKYCPFVVGFITVSNKIVTWKCGGVIINKNHVLTTASCLKGVPMDLMFNGYFRVRSNTSFLEEGFESFVDHKIIQYNIHGDYSGSLNTRDSNIAVAIVLDNFETVNEKTLRIPRIPLPYLEFDNAVVYTWHKLVLQATNVSLSAFDRCKDMYNWAGESISERMVCGRVHGRENFCTEMEGSPLVRDGELFGLASYAQECSTDHFPAIFTKVDMFRSWLIQMRVVL